MIASKLPTGVTLATMLALALANPVPEVPLPPPCWTHTKYAVTKQNDYWKPVQIMSGQICNSSANQPCSLGRIFEHSFGIESAVGIEGGVELTSVLNCGVSWSVGWSVTDSTATSVGENCPSGDPAYSCALTASAHYIHVEGTKQEIVDSGTCDGKNPGDPYKDATTYSFDAPVVVSGVNSNDAAEVQWAMCIAPQSKNQNEQSGLPLCKTVAPGQLV